MSWLGGSFTTLTGQLSNLTKDILTEGTEEVSDHVTELRLAQEKIRELDTVCVSQKIEIDRLKLLNSDSEEKAEGSELQINRISTEYRALLEEKQTEIKALKLETQELKSSFVRQDSQPAVLRLDSDNGFEGVGYGRDELDFSDSIAMQHDINHLRSNLRQMQTECQHWKSLIQNQTNLEDGAVFRDHKEHESNLRKEIQDLQLQLAHEKDTRQHALSTLQDAQTHKIAQMRKKHKEEVTELKAKMQEMDWGSEGWETEVPEETANLKTTVTSLREEISTLKSDRESHLQQITSLTESVKMYQSDIAVKQVHSLHLENQLKVAKEAITQLEEDGDQVGRDLVDTKQRLLDQMDANHADTLEVLSELRDVRQHMDLTAIDRRNKLLMDKDKLVNLMITSNEKKRELECAVENLSELNDSLKLHTTSIVQDMGDTEQQKLTAGVVDSLEKENLVLREQSVGLREQVTLLEKALHNVTQERHAGVLDISADSDVPVGEDLVMISDSASLTSDLSEMSRRNLELDEHVSTLKSQIDTYETEIGQFEMMQSDWLSEKEALESVLVDLRTQLKSKENSLNVAEAKKASMYTELVTLKTKLKNYEMAGTTVKQLQDKGKEQKKSNLSDQLKDKEEELQALISEKEDMEKTIAEVPELKLQLQQKQDELENLVEVQKTEIATLEIEVEESKRKLRGKNEDIVNLSLEKEEMMMSLEELDNQHQEAMSHVIHIKEQMTKSNDDMKMKMTSFEAEKQLMQSELDKLKTQQMMNQSAESSSSNELNHQISELKDETSELRQRLDRSNNIVNKLEDSLENKEDQLKDMNEKLVSSAEALNNLHMDKQELQDKVAKYKTDLSKQAEKLKLVREENGKLKQEFKLSAGTEQSTEEGLQQNGPDSRLMEIARLEEEIERISSEFDNAQDQLKQKSAECDRLHIHLKKADNMVSEFNQSVECKDKHIVDLTARMSGLETVECQLKEKLQSTNQDCRKLQQESDKKHEECESFSRQLHAMENEVHSIKSDLTEGNSANASLSSQLDMLNKQVTVVNEKLQTKTTECDSLQTDIFKVKDLLEDTADRLHTKCEECKELTERVESLIGKLEGLTSSIKNEYDAQILSATGELVLVKEELASKTEEWERLDKELYVKDEEVNQLKQEKGVLQEEVEHLISEFHGLKESTETNAKELYESLLCDTQKQNVALSSDKARLKEELNSLNQKVTDQKQHYEMFIEEIKSSKETDDPSQVVQYDELLEKSHKKDLQISENESKINTMFGQMQACQKELEMSTEKRHSMESEHDAYILKISELRAAIQELQSENTSMLQSLKQHELTVDELNEMQEQFDMIKAENISLEGEVQNCNSRNIKTLEESKYEKDKLNAHITELQSQLRALKHSESEQLLQERDSLQERVSLLQSELEHNKQLVLDQEAGIADLNQKRAESVQKLHKHSETIKSQEGIIEVLKQNILQKDNEISLLHRKFSRAKSFIDDDQVRNIDVIASMTAPNYDLPALEFKDNSQLQESGIEEKMEKVETVKMLGMHAPNGDINIERSEHAIDVIVEIERLQGQLTEKDSVITELQRNNGSLLKMLDSKSKSQGGNSLTVMHKLETEMRALKIEREQMMDVLNDKSRESSKSKAEVQRLMNIVSSESAAMEKLQKDNQELMNRKPPNNDGVHIDDMQKETVKNLARIIRDKDLEIESLTQKNQTLLSVLQESSTEGTQINSLMLDKENLSKQLAVLQGEREQMIAYLNQKHQESVAYHTEVQRLTAFVNSENEKIEELKSNYELLVPQFEDKKQLLLKSQNELINYKQKYQELEVKNGQMIQQSELDETVDKALYDAKVQENNKQQERYLELMENVREKEIKIQNMYQQVSDMEQNFRTSDNERAGYKKQVDSFTFQIHGLQTEQGDLKAEIGQLKQQRDMATSDCQALKEINNKLTLQVQDRDFEVSSLKEKTMSLTALIQEQKGEKGQLENVMHENESTQKHIKQLTHERDQALLGLQQRQQENNQLLKDIQSLKEREAKLNRELDRLRQHLIQIEEGYTKEALVAEEREKELRTRLTTAEENALYSSSAVESANHHSSQQLDSVQQQLYFVSQQRDQAYLQISTLQEQNQIYSSSMTNLQMVLEEFQHEKERMVAEETERCVKDVKTLKEQVNKLQADLRYTKEQLEEASNGLEAASRLSEQLDKKEEAVDALREEVQIREAALKSAEDELRSLRSRNDDRVDKLVIKNLFLGYFTSPQNTRHEVLRAIGGVLLFTSDDFEKIEGKHSGGWVPGFLRFSAGQKHSSPPTTPVRRSTIGAAPAKAADNSFSQMFVKFLERESSPPPPTVRLPAEEMVRDIEQKQKEVQKPAYNPFTAPRHVAILGPSNQTLGSHNSQHILMSSTASVSQTLPTFAAPSDYSRTPPDSGRNTPATTTSGAILKDVLNR